ncbi:hypothetical protein HUU40_20680 [candidate division KSB1 bacterium]|nr:hypothetical protein [candidate division KSB1 bacterium]
MISVSQSRGVLHSCKSFAFRRIGTTNMPLAREEAIAFARKSRLIRFDNQVCATQLVDIDEAAMRSFVRSALAQRRFDIDPALPVSEMLDQLELQHNN